MHNDPIDVARACYQAFADKDRATIEAVPTQNFESQRNRGVSPAFRVLSRDRRRVDQVAAAGPNVTTKRAPPPGRSSTRTSPPCRKAMRRTSARPMPLPCVYRKLDSAILVVKATEN
jgi:hypothetical protein